MYRRLGLFALVLTLACWSPAMAGAPTAGPFPDGFWWGTALSAHSVEGNHTNDWTLWETMPGKIADGSVSGAACNHWELFTEDVAWMKKLGQNAVLISVEWSRLQPMAGGLDPAAVQHYRTVFSTLRVQGIEPIVILWDRTLPQWVAAYGGLECPAIILNFADYAALMGRTFGDLVDFWIPMRDPIGYVNKAFKNGCCPPGKMDVAAFGKAVLAFFGMHRGAWDGLRANDTVAASGKVRCQVGLLAGSRFIRPGNPANSADVNLARSAEGLGFWTFVEGVMKGDLIPAQPAPVDPKGMPSKGPGGVIGKGPVAPQPPSYAGRKADFLVFAYQGLEQVRFNLLAPLFTEKVVPPGCWLDEAGQIVYPDGLTAMLGLMKKYGVPLYAMVSYAEVTGGRRGAFLTDHVRQARAALAQGCDLRGFFYDPLLAGFEYERGVALKRGLLNVQFQVQERKPAGGADMFRALATSNGANEAPRKMQRPKPVKAGGGTPQAPAPAPVSAPAAPAAPEGSPRGSESPAGAMDCAPRLEEPVPSPTPTAPELPTNSGTPEVLDPAAQY